MRTKRIRLAIIAGAVIAVTATAVAAAATGLSSTANSNGYASGYGYGMMGGGYAYAPSHPTRVRTLQAARGDAQRFAERLGLRVGEVLHFTQNYYARLDSKNGRPASEVLIDPATGFVSIEYGPAMMWNTRYGMGRAAAWMMGSYGRSMMGAYGGASTGEYGPATTPTTSNTRGYGYGMMGGSGYGMMGGNGNGNGNGYGSGAGSSTTGARVSIGDARTLAQRWLDSNQPGVRVETGGDAFPGYYTLETLKGAKITGMISVNATTGAVWPHWWHGAFLAKWEA